MNLSDFVQAVVALFAETTAIVSGSRKTFVSLMSLVSLQLTEKIAKSFAEFGLE